jgi:hypothetical protein
VNAAEELVDAITARFRSGDSADAMRGQLAVQVAEIGRWVTGAGGYLPDPAARDAVARLFARLQTATSSGEAWLERAGSELAPRAARERVRRAYGLRPRDT